jgi:hypothetical protein
MSQSGVRPATTLRRGRPRVARPFLWPHCHRSKIGRTAIQCAHPDPGHRRDTLASPDPPPWKPKETANRRCSLPGKLRGNGRAGCRVTSARQVAGARLTRRFTARSCTKSKIPDRHPAQPNKPSRRNPEKHVVSRIHQAQRPRRALSRNAGAVSPVNY